MKKIFKNILIKLKKLLVVAIIPIIIMLIPILITTFLYLQMIEKEKSLSAKIEIIPTSEY